MYAYMACVCFFDMSGLLPIVNEVMSEVSDRIGAESSLIHGSEQVVSSDGACGVDQQQQQQTPCDKAAVHNIDATVGAEVCDSSGVNVLAKSNVEKDCNYGCRFCGRWYREERPPCAQCTHCGARLSCHHVSSFAPSTVAASQH